MVVVASAADDRGFRGFRSVYAAELAYVLASLRRLGVPAAELEDIAHDVFVVAHRRWADYDRSRPVRPWLFGIALRTAGRARERRWRHNEQPTGSAALERASPPVPAVEHDERDLLLRALDALDEQQRAVFIMHDLDERSAPDIASALGVPLNTVYSRLRLAREKLTSAVRRLQGERP